ncbi:DUF3122 domain-containing protein [Anthocerotibacter panamensis]|uniref:DUF3122 domain-containing protein n=1 Tax=Anthocerotibacter panamensis TaxID=2857077 RepID=UPI001C406069|nr:DUF3122 domain-containing protein [Anthocerotibacter panamensis]
MRRHSGRGAQLVGLTLLVLGLGACGTERAQEQPQAKDITSRITRLAERKANGVFYSIEDNLTDDKGDTWRVAFLKIFRQSGKVYSFVQVRVDPRYGSYTISTEKPLTLQLASKALPLSNQSQDRNRLGYYEVTPILAQLTGSSVVQLLLPLGDGTTRTLSVDTRVLKGWQTVQGIAGPNVFNYAGPTY